MVSQLMLMYCASCTTNGTSEDCSGLVSLLKFVRLWICTYRRHNDTILEFSLPDLERFKQSWLSSVRVVYMRT